MSGPSGYDLDAAVLPDETAVSFPTTDASDDFFAFLSGKSDGPPAGTPVTIDVVDHTITGGHHHRRDRRCRHARAHRRRRRLRRLRRLRCTP